MDTFSIPIFSNKVYEDGNVKQTIGKFKLRENTKTGLIDNVHFDPNLMTYDLNYDSTQEHSSVFHQHLISIIEKLKDYFPKGAKIVEVGCGAGHFVELVQKDAYFNIIGYDTVYQGKNPSIYNRYIQEDETIEADLVILRHVVEHIQNPHKFLLFLQKKFKNSYIYIEVPNFKWVCENQVFLDLIYEHVNYFFPESLKKLFDNKFTKHEVFYQDQYQYILAKLSDLSSSYAEEHAKKENWVDYPMDFILNKVLNLFNNINQNLTDKSQVYIWGGGSKGCMFLNYCQTHTNLLNRIPFIIDQNPRKWGKYMPNTGIKIRSKEDFFQSVSSEDILIIVNPIYFNEIKEEVIKNNVDVHIFTF